MTSLKDLHIFHVGDTVWPAFNQVTGMGLFGRRVLVVGHGPVGKGIAERARDLGAVVYVTDLDPVRLLEASHLGCETVTLDEGIGRCHIIVTATGIDGVFGEQHLRQVKPGAILFNAGHSNREIDIDWLHQQPHQRLKAHIERFDVGKTYLFLLAQGSLLNLAAGAGPYGIDQFDHCCSDAGIAWMFDGIPEDIPRVATLPCPFERELLSHR
jgi:adenosylhomocysteinase